MEIVKKEKQGRLFYQNFLNDNKNCFGYPISNIYNLVQKNLHGSILFIHTKSSMDFKNKTIFAILSFSIAALIMTVYESSTVQSVFITTFAEENQTGTENEAEVKADIKEQENKCKKDTECENENKINNSLNIQNKAENGTGTGQLTVIKKVTCNVIVPGSNGFTPTVLQDQPSITNIQYIPVGAPTGCNSVQIQSQIEPQDFEFTVTGNNADPKTFPGSSSGVVVTLGTGSYKVQETDNVPSTIGPFTVNIETIQTGDCTGTISDGDSKTCTFTNNVQLRESNGG